jgi:hypothetical protein
MILKAIKIIFYIFGDEVFRVVFRNAQRGEGFKRSRV